MTTDPTPLQERIARALHERIIGLPRAWERLDSEFQQDYLDDAAAVLPLIAAEVRKAQADALRSAVRDMGDWADEVYVIADDPLDMDTWYDITTGEWLTARADTIEKEN